MQPIHLINEEYRTIAQHELAEAEMCNSHLKQEQERNLMGMFPTPKQEQEDLQRYF